MKILRSWPKVVPPGRNYVHDDMPRLTMEDFDYRVLGDVGDDVLLLEWDLAVHLDELRAFVHRALATPDRVLVAPYRLYLYDDRAGKMFVRWAHRKYAGTPEAGRLVFGHPGEPFCHLFGFGMTYLPQQVVKDFMAYWPDRFADVELSGWHYRTNPNPDVPVMWEVRPVHMHYRFESVSMSNDVR